MKYTFLLIFACFCLIGCDASIEEIQPKLPIGATNIQPKSRNQKWVTFDLMIDNQLHTFLAYIDPSDSRDNAITEIIKTNNVETKYLSGTMGDKRVLIEKTSGKTFVESFEVNVPNVETIPAYTLDGDRKIILDK